VLDVQRIVLDLYLCAAGSIEDKVQRLVQTVGEVLDQAKREGRATYRVADEIANKRIYR
jgi:hypothetical protein